jgi:hypothetical protein
LFLFDCRYSNLEIVNEEIDDNELIYIGVNFEPYKNSSYYMKWGCNNIGNIYDQDVYLVDGVIQNTLGC